MFFQKLFIVNVLLYILFPVLLIASETVAEEKNTIVFDFEDGTLQGWEIIEGSFDCLVSNRPFYHNFPSTAYNKQGTYYFSTVEQKNGKSNDTFTGVIVSPIFILSAPEISFLLGGGSSTNVQLTLCTLDGQEHRSYRGQNTEKMRRVTDSFPKLVGKPLFLKVTDHETKPWGHITLDDFHAKGHFTPQFNKQRDQLRLFHILNDLETKVTSLEKIILDYELNIDMITTIRKDLKSWRTRLNKIQNIENNTVQDDIKNFKTEFLTFQENIKKQLNELQTNLIRILPELANESVLYVVRKPYQSHYHAIDTLFNSDEYNCDRGIPHKNLFSPGASLKLWNARTNQAVTLLETSVGVIRDPDIDFNANRVVLAIRTDRDSDYHIWELCLKDVKTFAELLNTSERYKNTDKYPKVEGKEIRYHPNVTLRPLTWAEGVADFDPIYLPDGTIVFASTREPKYNMCSRDLASDLYRMNGDGSNIYQITKSTLFEHNPVVLPDGRICYHRWEYVDRNFGDAHALWTVSANGLNQSVYWGNNTAVPAGVYNPAPIIETGEMLCIFGPHHALENGALAIIDRRLGVDGVNSVKQIWPESFRSYIRDTGGFDCDTTVAKVSLKYEDPYVIDESHFLVSRMITPNGKMGLYFLDREGNEILIREEVAGIYDACLVRERERMPLSEGKRDFAQNAGTCYVANVYEGTNMTSVSPGSVKYLRVVQSPEKKNFSCGSWNGQGYTAPGMNWHSLENKKILGIVPVEKDGSVAFQVPCDTFLYFQLLDEKGRMVQTMRSGTILQSGETVSCIGCHEDRLQTMANKPGDLPVAMTKKPQKLKSWYGTPREFGYLTEVQPVFDRLCVECHDYGLPAGEKLNLAADRDLVFNTSYVNLWNSPYIKCVGGGPAELLENRAWGSNVSPLIAELDNPKIQEHIDAKLSKKLTKEDMDRLCTWLDLNGVYNPFYESAWPNGYCGRAPYSRDEMKRLGELTGKNYYAINRFSSYKTPEVCFERPELSPCLARMKNFMKDKNPNLTDKAFFETKEYQEALKLIQTGASRLKEHPRADMPDFIPCEKDQERLRKYDYRRSEELRFRKAIQNGTRAYDPK